MTLPQEPFPVVHLEPTELLWGLSAPHFGPVTFSHQQSSFTEHMKTFPQHVKTFTGVALLIFLKTS